MTGHIRPETGTAARTGRLISPSHERNAAPILTELVRLTGRLSGNALEIGSGPGQHIAGFAPALPQLAFTPSDPDADHRASIAAWTRHTGAALAPPLDLDAAGDWPSLPEVSRLTPLVLVLAINVIHIAPDRVATGIVAGAARSLAPGGLLVLYGPFLENGRHTGDGNAAFDASLRARNPHWGLRDIADLTRIALVAGLSAPQVTPMPANNRLLAFSRA